MTHIRRNAWTLHEQEGLWNDTLLWYARAVAELQKRPLLDRTSWRFLAAIHDFDAQTWADMGYFDMATEGPLLNRPALYAAFWSQCQHSNWLFLPWHRGYLLAFERIVRSAVVALGGPESWALPYWNYNRDPLSGQIRRRIPPCFLERTLPDGDDNPLFLHASRPIARNGLGPGGELVLRTGIDGRPDAISDRIALSEPDFLGLDPRASSGFAGLNSGSGLLEQSPHNAVHISIGGDRNPVGLMSQTSTAGLDPVFWLHHANIDRLWEVWLKADPAHANPQPNPDYATRTAPKDDWARGTILQRFVLPTEDGGIWRFDPGQMMDLSSEILNYAYDDVSDPYPEEKALRNRVFALGVPEDRIPPPDILEKAMREKTTVELLGANDRALRLGTDGAETDMQIDTGASKRLLRSFRSEALFESTPQLPDRVFLNLEDVRGTREGMLLDVYLNLPRDADPAAHPESCVGTVSLFGLVQASRPESAHGGNGLHLKLEITPYVDALGLHPGSALQNLLVRLVPSVPLEEGDEISIGRISLYRQGD